MDTQKVLERFLDGDMDILGYFGDIETFFDAMNERGVLTKIDLQKLDSDDWQNEYLIWLYENDKDKFDWWMTVFLGDIEKRNDKLTWVGDRADLAYLFCDNRDISQKTIEQILSGDGDVYEPYWDTTDDVYRDVIEELNQENLTYLKELVLKELSGKQLSPETEEMELIAAEQGHNDYWEINSNVVSRIIDDEESMNSLLDDELKDLKSELYSIHSNAYNSAYEEELWEDIWGEINEHFDGKGEFEYRQHPWKKDTTIEKFIIPPSNFYDIIIQHLHEGKGYGSSGLLENEGSYLSILREQTKCLSFRVPDYADSRKVDKNVNLYFKDYL